MTTETFATVIGCTMAGGVAITTFISKFLGKGNSESISPYIKEQTHLLQDIRDNLLKITYELINQHDKLVTIHNSVTSLHKRFDDLIDRTKT